MRGLRRRARAAAVAALVLVGGAAVRPAPARADEVRMKDGRLLEGKVVEETASQVKLRLRLGGDVLVLRREEVASVERKPLPEEALAAKRKALPAGDAAARWALALEAKAAGLRKAYEELKAEVLALDPAHAAANEADGRVLHEGKWMAPAERDRLLKDRDAAAQAAKGLVLHEGKWVTPEEKEARERGLVLHGGKWVTEREAKEAQGLVEWRGKWVRKEELEATKLLDTLQEASGVPLTVKVTERFSVATVWAQHETDQVAEDCEKAYAEFSRLFNLGAKDRLFDDVFAKADRERRCHVVILRRDIEYQKFLDGLLRFHGELKKVLRPERVELMRKQKGFYLVDPDCWIVGYEFPYPKEQSRRAVVHKLSHVMLFRWHFKGVSWPGWWLVEGLGCMQEIAQFGKCEVFCITTGYGEKAAGDKWVGDSWKASAKQMATAGGDRRLADMLVLPLNELQPGDLVKAWSLVHYLSALDRDKFVLLVRRMKDGIKAADALVEAYGLDADALDARWRDYVRRTY